MRRRIRASVLLVAVPVFAALICAATAVASSKYCSNGVLCDVLELRRDVLTLGMSPAFRHSFLADLVYL
jgi:hypothetical protein